MTTRTLHKQNLKGAIVDVEPIRNMEDIVRFKRSLYIWCGEKYSMLFSLGVNTGLRASDIVKLKVSDIKKGYVIITEKKTGKPRRFVLNDDLNKELKEYSKGMCDDYYLFPSRKFGGPLSVTQVYRSFQKAGEKLDLTSIGTHSMRKSFGYHYYKATQDIATLQIIFNHSDPKITLKYIGITQEEIDESMKGIKLGF